MLKDYDGDPEAFCQVTAHSALVESLMEIQPHARFLSANQELRDFLRLAEGLASQPGAVFERQLKTISMRLVNAPPGVGDAARSETLDAGLRSEIAEYVKNLRALMNTLKRARGLAVARRVHLETAVC